MKKVLFVALVALASFHVQAGDSGKKKNKDKKKAKTECCEKKKCCTVKTSTCCDNTSKCK